MVYFTLHKKMKCLLFPGSFIFGCRKSFHFVLKSTHHCITQEENKRWAMHDNLVLNDTTLDECSQPQLLE